VNVEYLFRFPASRGAARILNNLLFPVKIKILWLTNNGSEFKPGVGYHYSHYFQAHELVWACKTICER
jgi:hypothetical protein